MTVPSPPHLDLRTKIDWRFVYLLCIGYVSCSRNPNGIFSFRVGVGNRMYDSRKKSQVGVRLVRSLYWCLPFSVFCGYKTTLVIMASSPEKKTQPKESKAVKKPFRGSRKSKDGSKSQSRSARAGLIFPVGRIHRHLRKGNYAERVGAGGPVYMAAVLEYLTAEVLELASKAARDNKKTRMNPRHIQLAVRADEELNRLLGDVAIPGGGVIPNINEALLPLRRLSEEQQRAQQQPQSA